MLKAKRHMLTPLGVSDRHLPNRSMSIRARKSPTRHHQVPLICQASQALMVKALSPECVSSKPRELQTKSVSGTRPREYRHPTRAALSQQR